MTNEPLKILIFTYTFLNYSETFIHEPIRLLSKGNTVKIVCCDMINHNIFSLDDIELVSYRRKKHRFWKSLFSPTSAFKNSAFKKKINQVVSDFSPDIIHCHYGTNGVFLWYNLENRKIPLFVTLHGFDASTLVKKSRLYRFALRALLKREHVVPMPVSAEMKSFLESENIKSKNFEILHLGIDIDKFKRTSTLSKETKFLQVSRFVDKKGHYFTVNAFANYLKKTNDHGAKLTLIGDGPLLGEIKHLVEKLNIQPNVDFVGAISNNKIKYFYENATVYVQHSIKSAKNDKEGIPISIMEAMAMQLPILSTFHGGIPELVQDKVNGLLVKEKDLNDFSDKMIEISSWPYLPENRERIRKKFNLQLYVSRLKRLYLSKVRTQV